MLRLAQVVSCTEAEGPGRRFALWFQGCPLRCPGCCNPEMLPFAGGELTPVEDMLAKIVAAQADAGVEGVTLLGGEPIAHAASAALLARSVQAEGLSVMIFSGYTLEEIQTRPEPEIAELLAHTDILVDGPYVREQPDSTRRWIGSTNQRIHFLSDRYDDADPRWRETNTLEIRLRDGTVSVNGFPAAGAVGLWRRPSRKAT